MSSSGALHSVALRPNPVMEQLLWFVLDVSLAVLVMPSTLCSDHYIEGAHSFPFPEGQRHTVDDMLPVSHPSDHTARLHTTLTDMCPSGIRMR